MFKKALIATCILAASSTVALAGRHYKDEAPRFKDTVATPPCITEYMTGPYVGLSLGPRVNYSNNPAVYKGLEATLSIGYAALVTPMFYLAGEAYAGDSAQLRDYPSAGSSLDVRSTWNYGASIIPGIMLTDNMVGYIRGGMNRTRFSRISRYATAWHAGIGIQSNIVQNWDIRAEYVYNQYNHADGVNNPYAEQFNFGIVYKFI